MPLLVDGLSIALPLSRTSSPCCAVAVTWTASSFVWIDGLTTLTAWAASQPNNAGYGQNGGSYEKCVVKTPTSLLSDEGCTELKRFMCKEMRGWP